MSEERLDLRGSDHVTGAEVRLRDVEDVATWLDTDIEDAARILDQLHARVTERSARDEEADVIVSSSPDLSPGMPNANLDAASVANGEADAQITRAEQGASLASDVAILTPDHADDAAAQAARVDATAARVALNQGAPAPAVVAAAGVATRSTGRTHAEILAALERAHEHDVILTRLERDARTPSRDRVRPADDDMPPVHSITTGPIIK